MKTISDKKSKEISALLCLSSTMVELLTQSPKIEGSNPTTGREREREKERNGEINN